MDGIRLIEINEEIGADNAECAAETARMLKSMDVFMVNVMSSPGSGKTSLILETARALGTGYRIAVIEGDIDSLVDSEKVAAAGFKAVQIRTGGACHLDAAAVRRALDSIENLASYDFVFVENIGNLVCPAEFAIGEHMKCMLLSVPEGDDKIMKYPLMFTIADALIVNKIDYLPDEGFSVDALRRRAMALNPRMALFEVSCRRGIGIQKWRDYLERARRTWRNAGDEKEI